MTGPQGERKLLVGVSTSWPKKYEFVSKLAGLAQKFADSAKYSSNFKLHWMNSCPEGSPTLQVFVLTSRELFLLKPIGLHCI